MHAGAEDENRRRLDRSLAGGMAWSGAAMTISQILTWIVTLVVARILTPTDYGIIGMAAAYMILAELVSEAGLSTAITQAPQVDRSEIAATGGLALLLGAAMFLVSAGLADPVAAFFDEPRVRGVVVLLSLSFIIAGFRVVPNALLARDLAFRRIALIDTIEAVILAVSTLLLALLGFDYWALAIGPVVARLVGTVLANLSRPHPLASPFPLHRVSGLARFGFSVLGARVAWYVYSNADFAIIGRVLGSATLGFYTIAWSTATVPMNKISGLYQKAAGPVLAVAQKDRVALRRYLLRLSETVAIAAFPATVGLAIVAPDFVNAILGSKWQGAAAPLAILALASLLRALAPVLGQVLVWTGHPGINTRIMVTAAFVMPMLFIAGTRWGATGVAAMWLIGYPLVVYLPLLRRVLTLLEMQPGEYLRSLLPAAVPTAVMALVVIAASYYATSLSAAQRLVLLPAAGVLAFGAVFLALYRDRLQAARIFIRSVAVRSPTSTAPVQGTETGGY